MYKGILFFRNSHTPELKHIKQRVDEGLLLGDSKKNKRYKKDGAEGGI
jgi:hypothetical protein